MSVHTTIDLYALSVDELKALRARWYAEAHRNGTLAAIQDVVMELGTRHPKKHGANWVWTLGAVEIVLDDWTGALYVEDGGTQVVASTPTSRVFVGGPWLDVVMEPAAEARARIAARHAERQEAERQHLLAQMGGAHAAS